MTRALIFILFVLAACLLGFWLLVLKSDEPVPPAPAPEVVIEPISERAITSVESYVRANIRQLSPEPEVLGGTFFVTSIDVREDGTGSVSYEDGHNAYDADFTYSVDQLGQPHIDSFVVTN